MFLNGNFQSPLPVLLYDFVAGHAVGGVHHIIHASGIGAKVSADVGECEGKVGIPVGFGKEGGDGVELIGHNISV